MPVVPVINREVQQESYQVPTPHFATPVKEAYTGVADADVANAGKISQIVGGVADKVLEDQIWQQKSQIYADREALQNHVTDLMTNSGTEELTDANGNITEVPSGLMMKQGHAAQGATEAYQTKVTEYKNSLIEKYKNPRMKAEAERMFNGIQDTGYRQIANHEGTQVRNAINQTFHDSALNEVRNMNQKLTPDDLMDGMEHVHDAYMMYGARQAMTPEQITAGLEPMYAKAAENSAMAVLRSTGDIDRAMTQLDTVKTLIPNDYEKISESLTRHNDVMTRQVEHQNTVEKVQNQFGLISDFAVPGSTPPTQIDVENMVKTGKADLSFATDYNSALKAFDEQKASGKFNPDGIPLALALKDNSDQMDSFAETMKNIMMSADGKQVQTVLQDAMKMAAKGDYSEDKMKITMFYALQRGNYLEAVMQGVKPVDPALMKMDGGIQSLLDFSGNSGIKDQQLYTDFFDALKGNSTPKEAAETARQNAVLKVDPTVSTWDSIPVSIKRSPMTSAITFKTGAKVYPHARLREGGDAANSGK